ncbi:sensor histidine kinase [Kitasatospora cineracea]|uniref:sensor histidine kinase n=1 Tax=Kitasatospora cineracea TaxID=88074 RepID=UPI0034476AD4
MDRALPRPPWPSRLPTGVRSAARSALTWCAAALFALLLFAVTSAGTPPLTGLGARGLPAVLLALPVGAARRRPAAVFGVLLAESCAAAALGARTWPFFLAAAALVGVLAATRPPRTALAAAGAELALWSAQWWTAAHPNDGLSDFLSTSAALAAAVAIAWLAGNSLRQQREYATARRAQELTAERLRIAREVHDTVAHGLGVIAIQAGAAQLVLDARPADARTALAAIETTSRESLAGLRRMLVALRRTDTGDGGGWGGCGDGGGRAADVGLEAVERLTGTVERAGVRVEVHWEGERRPLPPEADTAAFRIVQESLTNTVRHSGARHCRVRLRYGEGTLAIEVVDDGRAGPPAEGGNGIGNGGGGESGVGTGLGTGLGIAGMRERVALLGGRFAAGPRPGGGYRVAAELPV